MTHDVAVIGLGAMGAALARAQLAAGFRTIVWNRTRSRAKPLAELGATVAATGAEAASAASVVLICLDSDASSVTALDGTWGENGLRGRVVAQLSTTRPAEAREFEARVTAAGGVALDGAIMCYPSDIGPENTATVMVGGDPGGFVIAGPFLRQLSKNLINLGGNIAAAAALDMGLLTTSIALYAGVAHAARLCEAEGADVALLGKLCVHGPVAPKRFEIIARDAFALNSLHDGGSLQVWTNVADSLCKQADAAGINADLPEFLRGFYRRAVDAGHGAEDVAALVKILRES